MQCMFTRRRLDNIPTLVDLFADMEVLYKSGRNSDTLSRLNLTTTSVNNNVPATGVCYLFSVCNGYIGIWKVVNRAIQSVAVKQMSEDYGGIVDTTNKNTYYCSYYSGGYLEATYSSGTTVYGATIAFVRFPSYREAQIEGALKKATYSRLVGRNLSTYGNIRTNDKSYTLYICAGSSNFSAWSCDGTTWERLSGTGFSVSGDYLTYGTQQPSGTIVGVD